MAKQKKGPPKKRAEEAVAVEQHTKRPPLWSKNRFLPYGIIALFTFLIYSNSLLNTYAIDDTMVLTDNTYTKKGVAGIKDIFTHDAFVGFFGEKGSKLVTGGRYRPLSIATFAVEYEISRKWKGDTRDEITDKNIILGEDDKFLAPAFSHFINILLFILTCFLLYRILKNVLPKMEQPFYFSLAFIATMLFAAHPIHTEAVTNIKGRDEIMGLLFALAALLCSLLYVDKKKIGWLFLSIVLFFLGLLAKENVITFLAIVPLTFYFFKYKQGEKLAPYFVSTIVLVFSTALYLVLRNAYTESGITADSTEILNNPFAFTNGSLELRYATIIYTFLQYFKLLLFPIWLTHDYYYNQIPYREFADVGVLFSVAVNVALVVYALVNLPKKTIPSYAILFYFITFSVVSNVLFTVGILMNERFMFFSSVGFSLLLAYFLIEWSKKTSTSTKTLSVMFGIILLLYGARTFVRNFDWKNNFHLFMTDVNVSTESAKIHTSCGGDLTKAADKETDSLKRKQTLSEAITHLRKAIQIYPSHSNAWLLLGNALYKYDNKQLDPVLNAYEQAQRFRQGGYYDALYNIGCVQVENGMADKSIENFKKALEIKPKVFECEFNLAEAFAKTQQYDSAFAWFQIAYNEQQVPTTAKANIHFRMGKIYGQQLNNLPKAIEQLQQAIVLNPNLEIYYEDLATAYGISGDFNNAIATSLKCLAVNPNYKPALMNLMISYTNKGDAASAAIYAQRLKQLP